MRVGFEAFEVIFTLPLTALAVWGVNATVKIALWPAVRVMGAVIPLIVKPVPVTVI